VDRDIPWRRSARREVALVAILFVAVSALSLLPVLRESFLRVSDTYFRVAPPPRVRSQVVIILIDDQSLGKYGRWPWSRALLARLTRNLSDAGATAVGLDILFAEPQSAEADAALAHAFEYSRNVVIVDKIGTFSDGPHWIEPLPDLARFAAVGHAQAVLDLDSVCRRFPAHELTPGGSRWAFAVEMAKHMAPQQTERFLARYGVPARDDSPAISRAEAVLVRIPFRRDAFETISAGAALEGRGLERLRGRPAIVGFGPTEIGDRITTPLGGELPTPGVQLDAQVLDSILTGRHLVDAPWGLASLFLLMTCCAVISISRRWAGWLGIALVALAGVAVYGACLLLFVFGSRVLSAGPGLLAVMLGPALGYAADLVVVERSVNRQLLDLRSWLESQRRVDRKAEDTTLFWRLDLLQRLQAELGSAYELHQTLLESTDDLVAVFDAGGRLLLENRAFARAFPAQATYAEWRRRLRPEGSSRAPSIEIEAEFEVNGEPYLLRVTPLAPTTVAPGGGNVVTLASQRTRVERDRARDEALGFVTHELRTPLVAIQGFAELMMRHPQSPAWHTAPTTIFQESRRLLGLINSYLDVLRLDTGARPLQNEVVGLPKVAGDVCELLSPLARAARMRLVLEESDGASVVGDAALLFGAVLNLVSNAIKYATPGTDIHISCNQADGASVVTVHNHGTIADDSIPRIFDAFYRAPAAEAHAGWGLGLAFVQRIAARHGGSVRALKVGQETVFEMRLPAADARPLAVAKGMV